MATKWQRECITALATSPLNWELFKLKQRNKKVLDQYINRIWPYQMKREKRKPTFNERIKLLKNDCITIKKGVAEKGIDINKYMNVFSKEIRKSKAEINIFIFRKRYYDTNDNYYCITDKKKFKRFIKDVKELFPEINNDDCYYTVELTVLKNDSEIYRELEELEIHDNDILTMLYNIYNSRKYSRYKEFSFKVRNIIVNDSRYQKQLEIITSVLTQLRILQSVTSTVKYNKISSKKETVWKKESMNVGIEIEHVSNSITLKEIQEKILHSNCVEYDSGFDGNCTDRLRENRIRLNGIQGTKGLYILLEDMKKNCRLDSAHSSVHMHIDCTHWHEIKNRQRGIALYDMSSKIKQFIKDNKTIKKRLLCEIFDLTQDNLNYMNISRIIRPNTEYGTIEYRFCITSLNYSIMVIEILTLIHITKSFKNKTKLNIEYLKLLASVKKELTRN